VIGHDFDPLRSSGDPYCLVYGDPDVWVDIKEIYEYLDLFKRSPLGDDDNPHLKQRRFYNDKYGFVPNHSIYYLKGLFNFIRFKIKPSIIFENIFNKIYFMPINIWVRKPPPEVPKPWVGYQVPYVLVYNKNGKFIGNVENEWLKELISPFVYASYFPYPERDPRMANIVRDNVIKIESIDQFDF